MNVLWTLLIAVGLYGSSGIAWAADAADPPPKAVVADSVTAAHRAVPVNNAVSGRMRSDHWSLQPVKKPRVPLIAHTETSLSHRGTALMSDPSSRKAVGGNPIDAFIIARLSTNGLSLSPAADRTTLIRRLSFDLLGLPPSPRDIDEFVNNRSPRAFEELVDRLLASPRYGERWGRHWLDVVRYTESQGFEYDRLRDNAWHYRDYVIQSFNDDKPYDRFMKEQIAGDVLEPLSMDAIIGPSMLVCGPWDEAGNAQANATQKAITREDELEDTLGVVGQTFLGLTINCARCHAHKFDPIPHEDYYRIRAVFDGVKHGERPIVGPAEVAAHEAQIAPLKTEIAAAQEQVARLKGTDPKSADYERAVRREKAARAALDTVKPLPASYAGKRVQPAPTRRLRRGDVTTPEEIVTPAALSAIADLDHEFGLPADAPEAQRRLKFANWLADPRNPLPARVMANRVWQFHFGQGLAATPSDLGASGVRPTHPELLDWLAVQLIERGWSVKALHRLILNSETYQQASDFNGKASALDADNQLLWRYSPRRLEGEVVRDAMLAVSGQINLQMGGPSFRPFDILKFPDNAYVPVDKPGPEYNRRTVLRMNVNSGKEPLLDALDCPDPSVKTPRRGITTTPLQALGLMNNSFVQRQAARLADRAWQEGQGDPTKAVQTAYRLALGRVATTDETQRAVTVVGQRSLVNVCWTLLNSTEFIYVR